MSAELFLRGLVIGVSIAAPVGPIGVLCIRRTLAEGRLAGFVSGLGAASADGVYGCVAGFGLTAVTQVLLDQSHWLRLVGGLFLCYLGIKTALAAPASRGAVVKPGGLAANYASTFLLTLTNPMTILSFTGVFAGLGLTGAKGDFRSAAALVAGVFLGSAGWWLVLNLGVGWFRAAREPRALVWINRLSGAIIFGFGCWALSGRRS